MEKCAKALKTLDNFKETAASMDIDAESPEFEESPGPTFFRAAVCLRSNVMDGATSIPFLPKPTDISDQAASAQVPADSALQLPCMASPWRQRVARSFSA